MIYTTHELDFLRSNWDKGSSYELARQLGRKQSSVSRKLRELGLITSKAKKMEEARKLHKLGKRKCFKCQEIFPNSSDFFHRLGGKLQYKCKKCSNTDALSNYHGKHNSIEGAIRHKLLKAKRANRTRFTSYLSESEALEIFNAQGGRCYYTGDLLEFKTGLPNSFSMDRKDPSQGYSKENVVFCCSIINLMKQSLLPEDFLIWCKKVSTFRKKELE